MEYNQTQRVVAIEGQTINIKNADRENRVIIDPATDLNALSFVLPSSPPDGLVIRINSYKKIASVSFSGGTFKVSPPTMLYTDASLSLFYLQDTGLWYQIALGNSNPNTKQSFSASGTIVSNGNITLNLTVDGTTNGANLFTTTNWAPVVVINDSSKNITWGWSFANSNKQIIINVKYPVPLLGTLLGDILGTNGNLPNGTIVYVTINGV